MKVKNMDEVVNISDSDDEAVPSSIIKPPTQQLGVSSVSDMASSFKSAMTLFRPSMSAAQSTAQSPAPSTTPSAGTPTVKKKLSAMNLYPNVRDVILKMRSVFGSNNCQSRVMDFAQQYICSLKLYQAKIYKCPNRCRVLAKHITHTMFLIRDLSRHFFDSPHFTQKMCELLAIYIFFELQSADDFKDSKIKIAERIIHNINLHLESADSNFKLRIFAYIPNMGKENEIVSKIFQRLIPETAIVVKNEFKDRLFIQYLIAFYHWKEAWTDYEDQQRVITFANKFMKPMITIKSNKLYAKHLPCYTKRDDATGYFLTNLVFFNDLRNASILDGVQDNGPSVVDLSGDDKEYSPIDLSVIRVEKIIPLLNNIKLEEPQQIGEVVDLTDSVDDPPWLRRLVVRAVEQELKLPSRLNPAVHVEEDVVIVIPGDEENEEVDLRHEEPKPVRERVRPHIEESNSMDSIYNQLDSSMDICEESTRESDLGRKTDHTDALNKASDDPDRRLTFAGIIEKELNSFSLSVEQQQPTTSKNSNEAAPEVAAVLENSSASDSPAQNASLSCSLTQEKSIGKPKEAINISVATQTKDAVLANEVEKQSEQVAAEQEEIPPTDNSQPLNDSNDQSLTITTATEVPKEAVTLSIDKFTSAFDSSDESTDTLFGGYKRPPLKTYLRRSFIKSPRSENKTITTPRRLSCSYIGRAGSEFEDEEEDEVIVQKKKNDNTITKPEKLADGKRDIPSPEKTITVPIQEATNKKVLFSATPSYLKIPDSVEVSSKGSNVVFSMQGRRLSSFPSLRVSSKDQSVPDFDLDSGGEDNNASEVQNESTDLAIQHAVESTSEKSKSVVESAKDKPKSVVVSTSDKLKSIIDSKNSKPKENKIEKPIAKSKTVWFAEKPEVHEIERLESLPSSQEELSPINPINPINTSTINKISLTKQLLTAISSSSTSTASASSTTAGLIDSLESNKVKLNLLPKPVKRQNPITTEPSEETAALKKDQEQVLYQTLLFNSGKSKQVDKKAHTEVTDELIEATRSRYLTLTNTNKNHRMNHNRKKVTPQPATITTTTTPTMATACCKQKPSEFDKYLLMLAKKREQRRYMKKVKSKNTEQSKAIFTPRSSNISVQKSLDVVTDDPKLCGKKNPVVPLVPISRPVLVIKTDFGEDTYTETLTGVFKLRLPPPPPLPPTTSQPTINLGDILTDMIEKEIRTVSIGKEKSSALDETVKTPSAILELAAGTAEKQLDVRPCLSSVPDLRRSLLNKEKEKEEEGKVEEEEATRVTQEPPLEVTVKAQYEMDLKIKKEELESKSPSPEMLAHIKQVSDCFKKPFKYATTKRLGSSAFLHGSSKSATPYKDAMAVVVVPVRTESNENSSEDVLDRLEINDADSSTNPNNLLPNTSESESDLSATTVPIAQTTECTAQPQSPPKRSVKVRLKRDNNIKAHLDEYRIISNSAVDDELDEREAEKGSFRNDGKKTKKMKSLAKKGEALKRIFERTESSTKGFEQSPQERSFNGAAVPNIESLNTPPPTPPTTLDDKSSVTDDSSQDSKTQKSDPSMCCSSDNTPSIIRRSCDDPPSIIRHINDNSNIAINENRPLTSPLPTATLESCNSSNNGDALRSFSFPHDNRHLLDSNSLRHYRRKFENSLPSANQKRPRKHSTDWNGSTLKNVSRSIPRKRRKTCSDVFNFSDFSLDEEICSLNSHAESPTIEVMKMHSMSRANKNKFSRTTTTAFEEGVPSLIGSNNIDELASMVAQNLSTNSIHVHSENMEVDRSFGSFSSSTSSRINCDSPLEATSRNLAVSRTYSKSNMVQQIFVPPEIEMFIEEPTTFVAEKTTAILPTSSPSRLTKRRTGRCAKTTKASKLYKSSDEEDSENDLAQDLDYPKKAKKKSTRGRKKDARGRHQHN